MDIDPATSTDPESPIAPTPTEEYAWEGVVVLTGSAVLKNDAMLALQMFAEELNGRWSSPPALPNYNILDLESQICAWVVAGCTRECTGHHAAMEGAFQLQHR